MSKSCPKCGTEAADDAKFCESCGYNFDVRAASNSSNIFKNGKIFLILIAAVVIIGAAFILTSGSGGNNGPVEVDNAEPVVLTISEVGGWHSDSGKKSYTLYTEALFTKVPSDLKGYLIKTIYYDDNDAEIGHETEKLEYVYYDTDYDIGFGYYTTYSKPHPDHVKVQIIKDGKVIDNFTEKIDTSKIDFLN